MTSFDWLFHCRWSSSQVIKSGRILCTAGVCCTEKQPFQTRSMVRYTSFTLRERLSAHTRSRETSREQPSVSVCMHCTDTPDAILSAAAIRRWPVCVCVYSETSRTHTQEKERKDLYSNMHEGKGRAVNSVYANVHLWFEILGKKPTIFSSVERWRGQAVSYTEAQHD